MSYQRKIAKQKVYCPINSKEETVFVHYLVYDNGDIRFFPNGCESSYHRCPECDACVVQSYNKFKKEFLSK